MTRRIVWSKVLLFGVCLLPLGWQVVALFGGALGVNPVETVIRNNGDWALRFLLITLAVTPLRKLTGRGSLMRYRRMLGLFSFFYAALHLAAYVVLDQFFAWGAILADILKRPYITVGMITFLLLLPLAITSTHAMQRRLGGRRWKRLHTLVYPAAVGAVLHYYLMVKADTREPLLYGAALILLLAARRLPLELFRAPLERPARHPHMQ